MAAITVSIELLRPRAGMPSLMEETRRIVDTHGQAQRRTRRSFALFALARPAIAVVLLVLSATAAQAGLQALG